MGSLAFITYAVLVEERALSDGDAIAVIIGLAMLAVAAAFARFAVRAWRAGVLVTPTQIVVRGPWGSESFPIDHVHGFVAAAMPGEKGNPLPGVVLALKDGSGAPIWALSKEGLVWNTERNVEARRDTVEVLNRALDAARRDRVRL